MINLAIIALCLLAVALTEPRQRWHRLAVDYLVLVAVAVVVLFAVGCAPRVVERVVHVHHYEPCSLPPLPTLLATPCDDDNEPCSEVRIRDAAYFSTRLEWWASDVYARCAKGEP